MRIVDDTLPPINEAMIAAHPILRTMGRELEDYPERVVEAVRSGKIEHTIPLVHALCARIDQYERLLRGAR